MPASPLNVAKLNWLENDPEAPSALEPYVKAYKEKAAKATPVGAFVNNQWASSTLGICLQDDKEAKELHTPSPVR